jgi:hypothetical protein
MVCRVFPLKPRRFSAVGGRAAPRAPAAHVDGDRVLALLWLRSCGMGRPKALALGQQMGNGLFGHCGYGPQ